MKDKIRKWLNIAGWSVLLLSVLFLVGFTSNKQNDRILTDINISIDRIDNNYFILENDVKSIINNLGYKADSATQLASVDLLAIEEFLEDNPFVSNADVYSTVNGKLNVEVIQRKPLVRIFNSKGESFYLDEQGLIMPLSYSYTARVVVATGNIDIDYYSLYRLSKNQKWSIDKFSDFLLKTTNKNVNLQPEEIDSVRSLKQYVDLHHLSSFINKDEFWKAQISQVYVNNSGEFELIPRVGNHTILLGKVNNLDQKFQKLKLFYKEGLDKTGWNEYSRINLKFKNQVVCTKI